MKKWIKGIVLLIALGGIGIILLASVRHRVDAEDKTALAEVLGTEWNGMDLSDSSYESQLRHLRRMQEASHQHMGKSEGMPFSIHRSASSVLEYGGGWCYDYSYWYEEALRSAGMKTRHVALYHDLGGVVKTLSTSQGLSHAATEVKTQKGWLLVEPSINRLWLDDEQKPLDARAIQKQVEAGAMTLDSAELTLLYPLYNNPYLIIHGLYSRHGRFYKPFVPVPDIHWGEFLGNL